MDFVYTMVAASILLRLEINFVDQIYQPQYFPLAMSYSLDFMRIKIFAKPDLNCNFKKEVSFA